MSVVRLKPKVNVTIWTQTETQSKNLKRMSTFLKKDSKFKLPFVSEVKSKILLTIVLIVNLSLRKFVFEADVLLMHTLEAVKVGYQ